MIITMMMTMITMMMMMTLILMTERRVCNSEISDLDKIRMETSAFLKEPGYEIQAEPSYLTR